MALSFEQQLAQVNGVVIPSPHPAGQLPSKPRPSRPPVAELDDIRTKTCPICGHAATRSREIRSHFVPCVKTNGNPSGARWHDNFNFVPRPKRQKRKYADIEESADADTDSFTTLIQFIHALPTAPHQQQQPVQQQRDNRQSRYDERVDAVNGIVIPSKLAPGAPPIRTNYHKSEGRTHAYPICDGLYQTAYAVQSHFPNCVEANGNPTGARWDDACTHPKAEQQQEQHQQPEKPPKSRQRNQQQRDQRQDRYYERLAAVDGIVIPSKLPQGVMPFQQIQAASGAHRFVCPICGRSHAHAQHVQSHFINCAKMNGNPTGARWDDACVFRNARRVNRGVSIQQQGPQTQDPLQPQYYDNGDLELVDSAMDHGSPLDSYQHTALQSAATPSDGDYHQRETHLTRSPSVGPEQLYKSESDISCPDPEPTAPSSSSSSFFPSDYPRPYSSYTLMERMASEALLSMYQG